MKLLPEKLVHGNQPAEDPGDDQGVKTDDPFQDPVIQERAFLTIHHPAKKVAAKGQAAHKGRQDRADGQGGRAEDEDQQPQPEHFIKQSAETGEKKAEQNKGFKHSHS